MMSHGCFLIKGCKESFDCETVSSLEQKRITPLSAGQVVAAFTDPDDDFAGAYPYLGHVVQPTFRAFFEDQLVHPIVGGVPDKPAVHFFCLASV
jgi:flavin reductase (DIM6/NTAB) family NADH-FMN oxidoreductase RutF